MFFQHPAWVYYPDKTHRRYSLLVIKRRWVGCTCSGLLLPQVIASLSEVIQQYNLNANCNLKVVLSLGQVWLVKVGKVRKFCENSLSWVKWVKNASRFHMKKQGIISPLWPEIPAELGSVENEERGVWKMRIVELNEGWKMKNISISVWN